MSISQFRSASRRPTIVAQAAGVGARLVIRERVYEVLENADDATRPGLRLLRLRREDNGAETRYHVPVHVVLDLAPYTPSLVVAPPPPAAQSIYVPFNDEMPPSLPRVRYHGSSALTVAAVYLPLIVFAVLCGFAIGRAGLPPLDILLFMAAAVLVGLFSAIMALAPRRRDGL